MKFCKECGQEVENHDLKFCMNCGASLTANSLKKESASSNFEPEKKASVSDKDQRSVPKKPVSRKQKRNRIIASWIVVLFICLYFIGAHFTSQERLINNFTDAIHEGDAGKLASTLSFYESDEEIDGSDVEGFLAYLEEDPEVARRILDSLQDQAEWLHEGEERPLKKEEAIVQFFSSENNEMVMLQEGDGFLFYDTYELLVEPVYVTLGTNVNGTVLFSGEEEVAEADSKDYSYELGPLVPGIHTFKAVSETELIDLVKEEQVTLMHAGESVNLNLDASYVQFDVPSLGDLESRLIVNDEEVDFTISSDAEFGPVTLDGTTALAVEMDFPWGTMTTPNHEITDRTVPVSFMIDEELQGTIDEALQHYVDGYLVGWQENDISHVDYLSSNLLESYEEEFNYHHIDSDAFHDKQMLGMQMDTENTELEFVDGNYVLSVLVREETLVSQYADNTDKDANEQSDFYRYEFLYEDDWAVYDKSQVRNMDLVAPVDLEVHSDLYTVQGEEAEEQDSEVASAAILHEADEDADSNVEEVTLNYVYQLVEAINTNDYDKVRPYIKDGSELDEMQTDLVERLDEAGMTQEVLNATVTTIEETNGRWLVTTDETIKEIYASGEEEVNDYTWTYTVEEDGDGVSLSTIE
ncbi:putative membrane protein YvbJ [Virgibacillus natechei]|uniref:Membrane protein YvbJ n=1 Tax=Virgibacillus natechei TaxID=1216297 RepID=A0ABS4IJJ9_9BACI|nr:hypothetical protein [Virgibacillus natechei]MBP1971140.1 putative membrane protein YvbJ [Virgibacillus natechei]UZD12174.1 hypothetical protein OLD84_14735 [Virgibacillus natechei]